MHKIFEILNIPMLMEPDRFAGFLHGYRMLRSVTVKAEDRATRAVNVEGAALQLTMNSGYAVAPGGIAIIGVFGPMFKGYGAYGYADQSELRGAVRGAANDPSVNGIMLLIDSPGGSVAGTADLAAEIRSADAVKPVVAYIEDCGCSAAYWTAASARAIYSNGGMVGSIGVVTAIVDSSKYFEAAGIKVIPIVTGEMKAVGMEGQPVTAAQVEYVQGMIDAIYADFLSAVSTSRGMRADTIRKMEARVYVGQQAVENKLIDGVMSFDKAYSALSKMAKQTGANKRAKAMNMLAEMEG